jgi:hypothetical protein
MSLVGKNKNIAVCVLIFFKLVFKWLWGLIAWESSQPYFFCIQAEVLSLRHCKDNKKN